MSSEAATAYAALVTAAIEQRARIRGPDGASDRWSDLADRFRQDPRRPFDPNLEAIASYLRPEDVLLDVGGGAGRMSLPLAFRCREVINVEPSPSMAAAFVETARQAGIENARLFHTDWLSAVAATGDVSLVANVTYFVQDIVPFVEKLVAASRRRVIIAVSTEPPASRGGALFRLVYGEDLAKAPSYRELLPVLWDMDILPDVRVLGAGGLGPERQEFDSRDEAVHAALSTPWLAREDRERARPVVEANFDSLFVKTAAGFRRATPENARLVLITWETNAGSG